MFGRNRKGSGSQLADAGYLVLDGDWSRDIYSRRPVRVAAALDVDQFLEQRPMPSIWPDYEEFNSYVGGNDEFMCYLRVIVLLHHPNLDVRAQCLRLPHLKSNTEHAVVLAGLLIDPQVADMAAEAIWRMNDDGVHVVLNVLLSRGIVPSGYPRQQANHAIEILRSTCPQPRRPFLEREILADDRE
jgi:hypothetical protein